VPARPHWRFNEFRIAELARG